MKYRVITGVLKARTAVHVGSGDGNELADSLLRRDTEGHILIPGTAIAGALRSTLTRLAPRFVKEGGLCKALLGEDGRCTCRVCRLFGDVAPSDEKGSTSAASRLLSFNAYLIEGSAGLPSIRDGVGIDRITGAAARAAAAKFDLETLPAGAEFDLRLEVREPEFATDGEIEADQQLLTIALAEWKEGRAHLGGDVARGLGAFDLKGVQYKELNLDDADGLMAYLREPRPWEDAREVEGWLQDWVDGATGNIQTLEEAQQQAMEKHGLDQGQARRLPITRGWAEWTFTLQAKGPFLTNDATSSGMSGFDHAPLLATLGDWTKPVLTGAGLRGVLRSHAERIARTLVTNRARAAHPDDGSRQREYFLDRCPACDPLARRGHKDDPLTPLESCDSRLRYELSLDEDKEIEPQQLCLACRLFGSTRNGSRLLVEDAPYTGDGLPVYRMLDFLAIDRFTGGGAEHLKFDALVLWRPAFKVRIFLQDPEPWELGWLTLALRDLVEGWLHVGFGAAKGFGQVTISEGVLRRATLDAGRVVKEQQSVYVVDEQPLLDWTQAAEWVKAFQDEIAAFERETAGMALSADSYFGEVDSIYGRGEAR